MAARLLILSYKFLESILYVAVRLAELLRFESVVKFMLVFLILAFKAPKIGPYLDYYKLRVKF